MNPIFAALIAIAWSPTILSAQGPPQPIPLPTEVELGRVTVSAIIARVAATPPSRIFIFPSMSASDGKSILLDDFAAVVTQDAIAEFFTFLATPSDIATADESTPCLLFSVNGEEEAHHAPVLTGTALVRSDSDSVRLRIDTHNPIFPRIDLVYTNTGFGVWLKQRALVIESRSRGPK